MSPKFIFKLMVHLVNFCGDVYLEDTSVLVAGSVETC